MSHTTENTEAVDAIKQDSHRRLRLVPVLLVSFVLMLVLTTGWALAPAWMLLATGLPPFPDNPVTTPLRSMLYDNPGQSHDGSTASWSGDGPAVIDPQEAVITQLMQDLARLAGQMDGFADRLTGIVEIISTQNEVSTMADTRQNDLLEKQVELSAFLHSLDTRVVSLDETLRAEMARSARIRQSSSLMQTRLAELESAARADSTGLRTDVTAILSSLGQVRRSLADFEDRLTGVASDVYLITRYGYGQPAQPARVQSPQPGASTWTSAEGGGARITSRRSIQQGDYEVGDFVGGYGVVMSIRRTPEGDYLNTENGTLFAAAASTPSEDNTRSEDAAQ